MSHLLVVANETVAGKELTEAVLRHAETGLQVTVVCPVNAPREGYVVYQDTRRAAARRRLDKALADLREAGIAADGFVVDANPVDAVRDALAQLEPSVTEIVVSTHPVQTSGWLRQDVLGNIRKAAGEIPVEHVVVDMSRQGGVVNVLVIANETVLGDTLMRAIKERAAKEPPASFMLICPQSDPAAHDHPEALPDGRITGRVHSEQFEEGLRPHDRPCGEGDVVDGRQREEEAVERRAGIVGRVQVEPRAFSRADCSKTITCVGPVRRNGSVWEARPPSPRTCRVPSRFVLRTSRRPVSPSREALAGESRTAMKTMMSI